MRKDTIGDHLDALKLQDQGNYQEEVSRKMVPIYEWKRHKLEFFKSTELKQLPRGGKQKNDSHLKYEKDNQNDLYFFL